MDNLQLIREQFNPRGEAETGWLQNIFSFVSENLHPLPGGGVSASQLSVCVVKRIQENTCVPHTLPVSYRPVCVSELVSRQHLPCVSNLSWSTNQQRAWEQGAGLSYKDTGPLPRAKLLLIGCLRASGGGAWSLVDNSGTVRCECLSLSPVCLNRPVFLPHWNYIPNNEHASGGLVELIGSPVFVLSNQPDPNQDAGLSLAGSNQDAGLSLAAGPYKGAGLSVREAAALLKNKRRGERVCVYGQVGSVCPLLVVSGTTFFIFSLTDGSHTLSVLVKDPMRLCWAQCVCVGQSVCVSALRVCVLRGWSGNNILCVTDKSKLHTNYTQEPELPVMSQHEDSEEAGLEREDDQSAVRIKRSRIISYQGTVTEVVSEGAGLYLLDGQVCLCLAYQPCLYRRIRAGDKMELHHMHFFYRACADFSPSMLCVCLRSTVRVISFSRSVMMSSPGPRCPDDGVLPRLLLEKNVGVSQYLWTCHLASQLAHSLAQQQCVCVLAWRVMERVWAQNERKKKRRRRRRDIYAEMLDHPHSCPLTQYSVNPAVCQYVCVSELSADLKASYWSNVSLHSLLPPGGGLTKAQLNSVLAWSYRSLSSDPHHGETLRQRPLLVVGVIEASEQSLRLRDATGNIHCVATDRKQDGGQRAIYNTAWIGCLVCVQRFTMVTERFLSSHFPSEKHLDQDQYITHTHYRVYLQFSLDCVHVLSPSVAMATHLRHQQKGAGTPGTHLREKEEREEEEEEEEEEPKTHLQQEEKEEEEEEDESKRKENLEKRSEKDESDSVLSEQCVAVVTHLPDKKGAGPKTPETHLSGKKEKGEEPVEKKRRIRTEEKKHNKQLEKQSGEDELASSSQPQVEAVAMVTHPRHKEGAGPETPGTHLRREEGEKKREEEENQNQSGLLQKSDRECVSMIVRVEHKEGIGWTNTGSGAGLSGKKAGKGQQQEMKEPMSEKKKKEEEEEEEKEEEAGLVASFSVRAAVIGPVVDWRRDPKNEPMTDREIHAEREEKVLLSFSGVSSRWFPLVQSGCFYRVIATHTQDPSVLIGRRVARRIGVELHADVTLQVRSDWRIHTLTANLLLPRYREVFPPAPLTVSEMLEGRSELVSFQAVVSERISLNDRTNESGDKHTGVRLTVCEQNGRSLQVYLDLSHTPYPPGLLPGNTLLLAGLQKKLSRTGSVYCRFLPVSSVTVVAMGDSASPAEPPMMHLGPWSSADSEHRCIVGRIRAHLVCVLMLNLQWSCSLCGAIYRQGCTSNDCGSTSSVFQAKAKLVVEDGTAEAQVWLSGDQVRAVLGLAEGAEWTGLQRALRDRGHIRVQPWDRTTVCESTDLLMRYLLCVCSSEAVCLSACLTVRKIHSNKPQELKRFSRGERDFMTKMAAPLQLTCLQLTCL